MIIKVSNSLYINGWIIFFISGLTLLGILFFIKRFTKLTPENFESFTTHNELIIKIRILSILSATLFPLAEYYESLYLNLYPANWQAIFIILFIAIVSLALSFKKNLATSFAIFLPQISYFLVYAVMVYKSLKTGMLPVMAIETACLVLFSKLIFTKLKAFLVFLIFIILANTVLLNIYDVLETQLDIYLSATIQATVVSVALFLIEGSTNRKLSFGNKILESSNLFILVANAKANFVFVNQHLEDITGLQQHEILNQGWWNYRGQNKYDVSKLQKLVIDSIQSNKNSTYESIITDKAGKEISVSWENTIIEKKYLLAVGKDITEAKRLQSEELTRETKISKYSACITQLVTNPMNENGSLTEIQENVCKSSANAMGIESVGIWSFKTNQLVCQKIYSTTNDGFDSGEELNSTDFPVYFSKILQGKIINAADVCNHEDTREFAEGDFLKNNVKSLLDVPIFLNGQLQGVLCCEHKNELKIWDLEDINFVKSVADFITLSMEGLKRHEIEKEYSFILNNVGDIIYTTDYHGNFDFINKTASNLLGYDLAYLKGKHFATIIHSDFKDQLVTFYMKQFKERVESTYCEFKVMGANGNEFWVGQNVKLVEDKDNPGKIKGFQGVVRDITKQKAIELALKESENDFRQINETIEDVFWLYDVELKRYKYISPSCSIVLGMPQEDFYKGKSFSSHFVLKEDLIILRNAEELLNQQDSYQIEYRIKTDNGKIKWISEKSSAIRNEKGELTRNTGICTDITEKKQQENQLKELSLVTQSVSNGVVISNTEGLIEWCNESFLKSVEYELAELMGKRLLEILAGPKTHPQVKVKTLSDASGKSSAETLLYTRSGKPKWFLVTDTPVYSNRGLVEKHIEIITDITDNKDREREYGYILDNAGDIIYTTDENGKVIFLNESVKKILGYFPEELTNRNFTHIIHPDDKKRVNIFYLKQFAQKREDSYLEFRVNNRNGEVVWVGQNVKLNMDLFNANRVKGFQAVLRNITERKKAEILLLESENNFRLINETINDVFYLFNMIEFKYDYVSQNCQNILGIEAGYLYEGNSFIGKIVDIRDRENLRNVRDKLRSGHSYEIEYRIICENEVKWIKEKSFAIKNNGGTIVKASGTYLDITQKKKQEKNLVKLNKQLNIRTEDLEINNLLKEQLIYSETFEEMAKLTLNTLKAKIPAIARGSLFLPNTENTEIDAYYSFEEDIVKDTYELSEIKTYPQLLQGKQYIEQDMDAATYLSRSDIKRRKENIRSYIMLPINYSQQKVGALALEFETPFSLEKREIDLLKNFTSVLSVVMNKLTLQKELFEKSNDAMDSLMYAKTIQQSILPNLNHHPSVKNFVKLYLPKDVVSGDFYIIESFDEYTVIALGDCTGHGVPGAFLTLLGSNFLQRIVAENKVTSPAQILELLDYQVFTSLNKNREETIRDGMEFGACVYDRKKKTLTFSGAGLFLVYYQNKEQFIIPGNKRSIGDENHTRLNFNETALQLNGSEKFYMFSDGYRDQLGGNGKRKRYSRKAFLELLNRVKNLPVSQQEYVLEMEHLTHKGKLEQTDDISVIGFELN